MDPRLLQRPCDWDGVLAARRLAMNSNLSVLRSPPPRARTASQAHTHAKAK